MGRFDLIEVTVWAGLIVYCFNYSSSSLTRPHLLH
jgi:hypothetical protein